MILQRKWRMEAAAVIQCHVRHAIFSQWGMPLLIDDDSDDASTAVSLIQTEPLAVHSQPHMHHMIRFPAGAQLEAWDLLAYTTREHSCRTYTLPEYFITLSHFTGRLGLLSILDQSTTILRLVSKCKNDSYTSTVVQNFT